MHRERGLDDRLVQRPAPAVAVEPAGVGQPFRVATGRLRRRQRAVLVEIELLEDDCGMHALRRDLADQPRANRMVRRIIVDFAEQAVTRRREIGDELRFADESSGPDVPDSRCGCGIGQLLLRRACGQRDDDDDVNYAADAGALPYRSDALTAASAAPPGTSSASPSALSGTPTVCIAACMSSLPLSTYSNPVTTDRK